MSKKQRGFSLIEIILVLAIIGVLLGVGIPHLRGMYQEAQITRAQADLKTLKEGLAAYWKDNESTYPDTLADLATKKGSLDLIPSDPFNTGGPGSYAYYKGTDPQYGDWFLACSKMASEPDADALTGTPAFDASKQAVVFPGTAGRYRCVSDWPVYRTSDNAAVP